MILRPYGIVLDGELVTGLEVVVSDGTIEAVRPQTGHAEPFLISPAFVNAHSHLEYRGMQGKIRSKDYWGWIREIRELKKDESDMRVRQECIAAAHENKKTGVGLIAEHSDRPFAATALVSSGIQGTVFQETITFFERETPSEKLQQIRLKAGEQAKIWRKPVFLTPHAYHTVDEQTLAEFGASREPVSIHVAETVYESQLTRDGIGPLADFRRQAGHEVVPKGKSVVQELAALGFARTGAQFVHCCDVDQQDIQLMARSGVRVAHCPRSNLRLQCPPAPVREMLDAGISVGLGMDSPASSGQIDMFDEMRTALKVSCLRSKPLQPSEVWHMATNARAVEFGESFGSWRIEAGAKTPLIKIMLAGVGSIEEVIQRGRPSNVAWV